MKFFQRKIKKSKKKIENKNAEIKIKENNKKVPNLFIQIDNEDNEENEFEGENEENNRLCFTEENLNLQIERNLNPVEDNDISYKLDFIKQRTKLVLERYQMNFKELKKKMQKIK